MSETIHTYYDDDNGVCIIRDFYTRRYPGCRVCGLREICKRDLTQDDIERVMTKISGQIERKGFWEEYGKELYD